MTGFVDLPVETDPRKLADTAIAYLTASIPGWRPAEGHVEVWLTEALARLTRKAAAIAAVMPEAAFREFGARFLGITQSSGSYAAVTTTWVMQDRAGYTVPAGTLVGYRRTGTDYVVFETQAGIVVRPGQDTMPGVVLRARDAGTASNAVPAGELYCLDAISWVQEVTATTTSAGGTDPETDMAFLDRLHEEMLLLTPRPILPRDFAVLARRVDGVYRALPLNGYDPGVNEIQQVAVTGAPTGGTFPLTFGGQTATGIGYNATASQVQAALRALSGIGPTGVTCTGGPLPGTPVLVEFTGPHAAADVAAMTTSSGSLTGGTSPTVAVTTPTAGVAASWNNERFCAVAVVAADGTGCGDVVKAAALTYLDGLREVCFEVRVIDPTWTSIGVTFQVAVVDGWDRDNTVASAVAAVTSFLDPSTYAGGGESPPQWRTGHDTIRYLTLARVIGDVPGVDYLAALTINGGTADVTLAGVAPLPRPGTITGTAA